jgi:hypothetical protein
MRRQSEHLRPPIVTVAHPAAVVACKDALLVLLVVVAFIFVILSSAASVETAAATDIVGLVRPIQGHRVPVHSSKSWVLREECSGKEGLRRLRQLREIFVSRLGLHHAAIILRHRIEHAVAIRPCLLLAVPTALLLRFFFEQWTYADTASFGPEMATKRICTSEASTATPVTIFLEIATANKLLLA